MSKSKIAVCSFVLGALFTFIVGSQTVTFLQAAAQEKPPQSAPPSSPSGGPVAISHSTAVPIVPDVGMLRMRDVGVADIGYAVDGIECVDCNFRNA